MSTQEVGEIFGEGSGPAHAMLRSPTVLIAAVGLWGMNIYFFRLFGINYVKVLKHDLIVIENGEHGSSNSSINNSNPSHKHHQSSSKRDEDNTLNTNSDHGGDRDRAGGGGGSGSTTGSVSSIMTEKTSPLSLISESISAAIGGVGPSGSSELKPSSIDYASDDDDNFFAGDEDDYDENNNNNSSEEFHAAFYSAITWERLVALSIGLLFLLHSTYFVWIDAMGGGQLGAVFAFYGVVTIAILFPLTSTRWLRKATVLVLQRSFELINPRCSCVSPDGIKGPRPVPFVDVFFADACCSFSKVFFDWGMLFHMMSHYPDPVPPGISNILVPSAFAAVPFVIRARQCLIMYNVGRIKGDPKRFSHLWNWLKYSTSIFPLLVSAYQKTIDPERAHELEPFLILLQAINASYSLYWDVVMDWGMLQNPTAATAVCLGPLPCLGGMYHSIPVMRELSSANKRSCGHAWMRPRLRFGTALSAVIVASDTVLRFSWMLRFYSTALFPSHDSFVLCTQFLEVFRRALWNLLRVEWENLKQIKECGTGVVSVVERSSSGTGVGLQMKAILPPSSSSVASIASKNSNEEEMTSFLPNLQNGKGKRRESKQQHDKEEI